MVLGLSVLSGCAAWSGRHPPAADHLEFLSQALGADARGREALWRSLAGAAGGAEAALRAALLQSLPGHSGTDAAAARARLQALAAKRPGSRDVASVARLRLAQLDDVAACRDEVRELRERLERVVEIERRNGRGNRDLERP